MWNKINMLTISNSIGNSIHSKQTRKRNKTQSSHHGAVVNESDWEPWGCGFEPWPCSVGQRSGIAMNCGVGCRRGSDPVLLWLWHRPEATALIRPLAWEPPYAEGVALEKTERPKKEKNKIVWITMDDREKEATELLKEYKPEEVYYVGQKPWWGNFSSSIGCSIWWWSLRYDRLILSQFLVLHKIILVK